MLHMQCFGKITKRTSRKEMFTMLRIYVGAWWFIRLDFGQVKWSVVGGCGTIQEQKGKKKQLTFTLGLGFQNRRVFKLNQNCGVWKVEIWIRGAKFVISRTFEVVSWSHWNEWNTGTKKKVERTAKEFSKGLFSVQLRTVCCCIQVVCKQANVFLLINNRKEYHRAKRLVPVVRLVV